MKPFQIYAFAGTGLIISVGKENNERNQTK
jgi:hypothetical protein